MRKVDEMEGVHRGRVNLRGMLSLAVMIAVVAHGDATMVPPSSFAAEVAGHEKAASDGLPVSTLPPELAAMAWDRKHNLWIGCTYGGLYRFRNGHIRRYDAYTSPIPDSGVSAIFVDDRNVKWIGTTRGYVYSFDDKNWRVHTEIGDTITRIRRDRQGRIWLLGDRLRYLPSETAPVPELLEVPRADGKHGHEDPLIMDVDNAGNVWVGTFSGITRYNGTDWTRPDAENTVGRPLRDIWCDPKSGAVYVASQNGYFKYDQGKWISPTPTIPEGKKTAGRIFGSKKGLAGVLNHLGRGATVLHEGQWLGLDAGTPLENDWLTGIAADPMGCFWFIGRKGGLRSFDGEHWQTFPVDPHILLGVDDPRLVWRTAHLSDLLEEEATEVEIHEALQNPREHFGKKLRFTGRIESSFECANFVDRGGTNLSMWPGCHGELFGFLRETGLDEELKSYGELEYTGYLEFGGYFGHMGGWTRQFHLTEVYPVSEGKLTKADVKRQLLEYLERIEPDRWIVPAPEDAKVRQTKRDLQGIWILEKSSIGGKALAVPEGAGLVFGNDTLVQHEGGRSLINTYDIDPHQQPAAIDVIFPGHEDSASPDGSDGLGRHRQKGIYKIEEDRLTTCFGSEGVRPRAFESAASRGALGTSLAVLRRPVKADEVPPRTPKPKPTREEIQSAENLKRLTLAVHNYADHHGHFPSAVVNEPLDTPSLPGRKPHSWRVALLPFLGHRELYDQYNFAESWDSLSNLNLMEKIPAVYRHPKAPADVTETAYFMISGPGTVQDGLKPPAFSDIPDGTSNTLLFVEARRPIPWTKPEDIAYAREGPIPGLGGYYEDRFFVGLVDGSAVLLKNSIDEELLRQLIEKADGWSPEWRKHRIPMR